MARKMMKIKHIIQKKKKENKMNQNKMKLKKSQKILNKKIRISQK